jgi:CRISPR type I-E-associated protein CasB/Cse2
MAAWPVIASLGEDIRNATAISIAALFAEHPLENNTARDFGATCRAIALRDGGGNDIPDSFQRRFRRLIACDTAGEVAGQLRAWIRLAASKGEGVNYERLFDNLAYWESDADKIRVRWAGSFWPARREVLETSETQEAAA